MVLRRGDVNGNQPARNGSIGSILINTGDFHHDNRNQLNVKRHAGRRFLRLVYNIDILMANK